MRADKKNIDKWYLVYLTPLVLYHIFNRKIKENLGPILVNLTHIHTQKQRQRQEGKW